MRNFGENFGVYISPVSLTRWISHRNHWKSSVAAHFMPWREIWFSEVLKSHFNVGGKTGKYCSGNLNLNPSSLHPLAKESLMGWCLEMTSRGKQDILPLCFGHRGTSVLLRGKEMMTQRNFFQHDSPKPCLLSLLSPLKVSWVLALGQGSRGSSSEALPSKSVFTDPEEYLIRSVLQAPCDGISWGLERGWGWKQRFCTSRLESYP